jgi:hypothetical protein
LHGANQRRQNTRKPVGHLEEPAIFGLTQVEQCIENACGTPLCKWLILCAAGSAAKWCGAK